MAGLLGAAAGCLGSGSYEAAVERIANAKAHWLKKGEPSDEDTPPVQVIVDYLDLYNAGLIRTNRLVIISH